MSIYCLPHVVEKRKVLTISSLPVLMQSYDKAAWRRANTPSHEVLNPEFLFIGNLKKMIKLYPFRITQGITLLMCMNNPNCIPLGLYGYYGNLVNLLLLIWLHKISIGFDVFFFIFVDTINGYIEHNTQIYPKVRFYVKLLIYTLNHMNTIVNI